jgi:hypothetical protein
MKADKLIDYIAWTLLIVSIALLNFTSRYLENMVYGKKFVWNYFLVGLTISSLWLFVLYKIKPQYFVGDEKRASAVLSQFFSIIVLTIFLNAFYTYESGKKSIYLAKAIVTDKATNVKTGTDYVHLLLDGRQERFNPKKDEFKSMAKGDTLVLTIGRGETNYDIIYEFKVSSSAQH